MKREILQRVSLALVVASTLGVPDSPRVVLTKDIADTPLVSQSNSSTHLERVAEKKGVNEQLINPLWEEAIRRREDRIRANPETNFRIDWGLGKKRLSLLLLGFGQTHEPPLTEKAEIGSLTIVSLDMSASPVTMDMISFTHDIRAPEIERFKKEKGNWDGNPIRIYRAYDDGGFDLLREVLEDASGLPIDYQIVFDDSSLKNMVDDIFGGVEVEVPMDFKVHPFYLEDRKYPEGSFEKGRERMSGIRVLQFIKTVLQVSNNLYPKVLEHNSRKHLFLESLSSEFKENIINPLFLFRCFQYARDETTEGKVAADFDLSRFFVSNIAELAKGVGGVVGSRDKQIFPDIRKTIYIVDSAHGDGGVQWVNASQSPTIKEEIRRGFYNDRAIEVPINADPYSEDLINGYWHSVRSRIKTLLTE
jgi:hypothetical protein